MVFAFAAFSPVHAKPPQRARSSSISGMELGRTSATDIPLVARVEVRLPELADVGREEAPKAQSRRHQSDKEQAEEQVPAERARLEEFGEQRQSDRDEQRDCRRGGEIAAAKAHRSTSPNTMSSEPRMAVTSASMWPRDMKSIAWRWEKPVGRIFTRYGLLVPSETR